MKKLLFIVLPILGLVGCVHKNPEQPAKEDVSPSVTRSGEDLFNYIGLGKEENNVIVKKDLPQICTIEPVAREIGDFVYPTHPDYAHLTFLGELFTASDCGEQRVAQLDSVVNGLYLADPVVFLNDAPSTELLATIEEIGFTCADALANPCLVWQMEGEIEVDELIKLKPFAQEIKRDDCVNCG